MDNELNGLMQRILKRLSSGIPPSAFQMGVDSKVLNSTLEELKTMGLITFEYIENHPVFSGEPKNFRLTTKGKKVADSINVPI